MSTKQLEKINIIPEQEPRALSVMTPMDMIQRAVESNASLEMVEKLMALQERWKASQALEAFNEAMAAAKSEIPTISKNREVDFTSSKGRTHYRYEDLGGIAKGYADDCAQRALKKNGVTCALVEAGGDIVVSGPPPGASGHPLRPRNKRSTPTFSI